MTELDPEEVPNPDADDPGPYASTVNEWEHAAGEAGAQSEDSQSEDSESEGEVNSDE